MKQRRLTNRYRIAALIRMSEPAFARRSAATRNRRRSMIPRHSAIDVRETFVSVSMA
ncbi:MAG: hypothetical protein OXM00_05465 [Paracoccaceae bacterium]|nr:hypothetical protein [Paracoccaceae bacterium]